MGASPSTVTCWIEIESPISGSLGAPAQPDVAALVARRLPAEENGLDHQRVAGGIAAGSSKATPTRGSACPRVPTKVPAGCIAPAGS